MRTLNQGKYFSSMYFVFWCILCSLFSMKKLVYFYTFDAMYMNAHAQCIILFMQRLKRADVSCLIPPSCDQLLSII